MLKNLSQSLRSAKVLAGILATMLMFCNVYLIFNQDKDSIEELKLYNDGVAMMDEEEFVDAIENFGEATVVLPENSKVDVNSFYNMGYIVATRGDGSVETLKIARALYTEALRISPNDIEVRKSIEIINQAIIEKLIEEGYSLSEAEESLEPDGNEFPKPSDGEEHSPGRDSEDDY